MSDNASETMDRELTSLEGLPARYIRRWVLSNLSTVLRAAGDDAVAEALREIGWHMTDGVIYNSGVQVRITSAALWRPVTPEPDDYTDSNGTTVHGLYDLEGDEHGE